MTTTSKFLIGGAAILAFGVITYFHNSKRGEIQSTFIPNRNNDKQIFVNGWTSDELAKAIRDFRASYTDRLSSDFAISISPIEHQRFRITFPGDLEPSLFHFLVNYLRYPRDLDLSGRTILIVGRCTLDSHFNLPDLSLAGQKASVYVPAQDDQYDLVFVRVDHGAIYEDSFASSTWKPVKNPRVPVGLEALIQAAL